MFLAGFTFPFVERALFGAVAEPTVLYGFFEMFLNLCVLALVVAVGLATARPVRNVAEEEQTTNRHGDGHSGGRRQS